MYIFPPEHLTWCFQMKRSFKGTVSQMNFLRSSYFLWDYPKNSYILVVTNEKIGGQLTACKADPVLQYCLENSNFNIKFEMSFHINHVTFRPIKTIASQCQTYTCNDTGLIWRNDDAGGIGLDADAPLSSNLVRRFFWPHAVYLPQQCPHRSRPCRTTRSLKMFKKNAAYTVFVPRRLFFAAQQRIAITWSPNYYQKMCCFITRKNQKEYRPDVK